MAVIRLRRQVEGSNTAPKEPARLQEVLDVAARLFREKGYRSTSVAQIGEALGMNKASLYYYVGSKEDIARQLILRAARRLRYVSSSPDIDQLPPEEALAKLVREHCSVIMDYPNEMGLLIQQRRFVEPRALGEITERERLYIAHVRNVIARGIADGAFRRIDPGVATQMILDTINGLLRWYRRKGSLSRDEAIEEVCGFVVAGIRASSRKKRRA